MLHEIANLRGTRKISRNLAPCLRRFFALESWEKQWELHSIGFVSLSLSGTRYAVHYSSRPVSVNSPFLSNQKKKAHQDYREVSDMFQTAYINWRDGLRERKAVRSPMYTCRSKYRSTDLPPGKRVCSHIILCNYPFPWATP